MGADALVHEVFYALVIRLGSHDALSSTRMNMQSDFVD